MRRGGPARTQEMRRRELCNTARQASKVLPFANRSREGPSPFGADHSVARSAEGEREISAVLCPERQQVLGRFDILGPPCGNARPALQAAHIRRLKVRGERA